MNINTNHIFLAFDGQINIAKAWLQAKVFATCGYSSEVLTDRLMQRLVEIGLQPYTLAVSNFCKKTSNCFPAPGTQISCGRASMEIGSGRITITPKQWLANQLDFFLHWAFCLIAILSVKKTRTNNLPAVLVYGVGEEALFVDNNDERFVTYCRSGPIEPLRSGRRFFVESVSKNVSTDRFAFVYCKRPVISLLCETKLGFFGILRLLVNHAILFFAYQAAVVRLPQLSLLGRDFAYSSISFELERRGLIESIILTCANHPAQPLWMKMLVGTKVHMIWYSQAAKQFVYASDNLDSAVPNYRLVRVDAHWVWTHAFAEYLRALVHDKTIEVVGPIVWYMPEIISRPENAIVVTIFDVSPYSDDVALRIGEIPNYNHPDNLVSFIQDIISLKPKLEKVFHLPVSFRLKMKRGMQPDYNKAYFDHVERLGVMGVISLESYTENLYSLISRSHLVIAYPFTSPAYVAEFLGAPCIFYDPTGSIIRDDFCDNRSMVSFANCPRDLLNAAISLLSKVRPEAVAV